MGIKLHAMNANRFFFHCPGCKEGHQFTTPKWEFNGDLESPTIKPSLLVWNDISRCHSFIENGRIWFLEDSTHELAGQTVEIPDWEEIEWATTS